MTTESLSTASREERPPCSLRAVWILILLGLIVAWAYYARLLSFGSAGFFAPVPHGLTFNSMLIHLLYGRFDIDPDTIGDEGTLRDGLIYTYFGIVPALLRAPFLLSRDFASTDFTRLSCLVAVAVMASFKMASALTVWRAQGSRERTVLLTLFMIAILFGGPQIQFLRALIYQEVILWAGAFAAAFVYFALRGYYAERGFTTGIWVGLALAAGLCLLTRVSTGLGLCVACALLWLQQAWRVSRESGPLRIAGLAPLLAPAVILTAFVAVAGVINYGRWGNPLTFAATQGYLWPILHAPDRIQRVAEYGNFNFIRLGYGLIYYFLPIWVLRTPDGNLLWSDFQQRTIDSVELPPSSLFISDPLIIGLAGFALFQLVRHRNVLNRAVAVPLLAGLFVPVMLILTLISMTFRYRMEFYPLFELCAFLGFGVLLSRRKLPLVAAFGAACVGGVVVSHLLLALYMLTPFGTASTVMRGMDVVTFYRSWFQ